VFPEIKKHIFIVSTGRTGTHFFKKFFGGYSDEILGLHEPSPSFKRRGYELITREPTLYERLYFKSFRVARYCFKNYNFYLEANNCLFSSLPLIRTAFPNSFIIHVIRDGREVVRSYMNSFKRYAKAPYGSGQLNPGHFENDPYKSRWKSMNPIEKTAWFWLRVNEVIEAGQPDMTVFFEKFFSPPHAPLEKIIEKCKLPEVSKDYIRESFANKSASSAVDYIPKWPQWPPTWKKQFANICGNKMEEYGYVFD